MLAKTPVLSIALPAASKVKVSALPPFMLYVMTALGVPVKIILPEVPAQNVAAPLIVAFGPRLTKENGE